MAAFITAQRQQRSDRRLFAAHHGAHGAPRIAADLRHVGWLVSDNTVAKRMREQHPVARVRDVASGTDFRFPRLATNAGALSSKS